MVTEQEEAHKSASLQMHSYCLTHEEDIQIAAEQSMDMPETQEIGMQCDPDPLLTENLQLKKEIKELKDEQQRERWGVHRISDNDGQTKFYTGIPTFAMFLWLFKYLEEKCHRMTYWTGERQTLPTDRTRSRRSYLQPIDQLFAVLMRNRLGLFVNDIAERFGIAAGTFSKYYTIILAMSSSPRTEVFKSVPK